MKLDFTEIICITMHKLNEMLTTIRRAIFSGPFRGYEYADTVVRYTAIAHELRKPNLTIRGFLEIGSGSQGIAPFVPFKITGVDTHFNGEIHPNLNAIRHSGVTLPFTDRSFDIVLSVDMLEHIMPVERLSVIREMLRTARSKVIIAVPCGHMAARQDGMLDELYFLAWGDRYNYLHEHVINGLPDIPDVYAMINAAATACGKAVKITNLKNFNIHFRYLLMRLWVDKKYYAPYLLVSLIFCIIKRFLSYGPCYRQIFIVDILDHEG